MTPDKNELKFAKKNFRHQGYTSSFQAMTNCLFVSREAKHVYLTLSQYCFGSKRECNPSQGSLALALRTTRQTVNKYIEELREKGVIYKVYDNNGILHYHLKKIETISVIRHSEIVWEVLKSFNAEADKLEVILKEYEQSELYSKVDLSDEPEKYKEPINKWFTDIISKNGIIAPPQKNKSTMDNLESLLNYFYDKYYDLKGEPMTPSIQERTVEIDNLWRAFKRCNHNLDELRKRIGIFFNSPSIQYHNTKVFALEITQSKLQHASNKNQDKIVMGVERERLNLFDSDKKPESNFSHMEL